MNKIFEYEPESKSENKNQILLGLSGGIDSEYSARLLLEKGYTVFGMYVNMLNKDLSSVERVAESMNVPLFVVDKADSFRNYVVDTFCDYYKNGKTPNPCVECNRYVKIQTLFEESEKRQIPFIATGHYANVTFKDGRYSVSKGADLKKDQSYFLWKLTQKQLSKLVFPLGNVVKETVLRDKSVGYKESQDICFIDGDYRDFLSACSVSTPEGFFIDTAGNKVGIHRGIHNYTRGQRKGLGIALGFPAYVTKINSENNTVTLGNREELEIRKFKVKDLNFQLTDVFSDERVYSVKTRYRANPIQASVKIKNGIAHVELSQSDTLVTPGQSAVFYDGDSIAFGGEIFMEDIQ